MAETLRKLRNLFFQGLTALLPMLLTAYAVWWIGTLIYDLFSFSLVYLPQTVREHPFLRLLGVLTTMICVFALVSLIGVVLSTLIGHTLRGLLERLLGTIPVIKGFYQAFKQFIDLFAGSSPSSTFSRTVLIEFPHPGKWTVGFVTGTCPERVCPETGRVFVSVYVPTVPNPTSAFLMLVPRENLLPCGLSVDQAFKFLISGGVVKN